MQQIQELQEQFNNLFEDSVKKAERRNLDKSIKADHKEAKELKKKISDCWTKHSCYLRPSVQSEKINDERIGYVKKLKKLIADGNQKLQKRDELNKEEAVKAGKENKATNKAETHKFSLTNEELMQQIQELQEQFNTLFEVDGDGLGQPAVDVPPSQNKIKRDRKTKDGKVELVSVEDELFPYDGNKKEQYRQKIIATINDMIQGKATLEDLLQIVRQKKAPLKEAMEVLEGVINERNSENRVKKEKWENKLNGVSDKEKIKTTAEIKAMAKAEKDSRNNANHYDHLAMQQPVGPVADEFNSRYQDYDLLANQFKDRKDKLIGDFSKKFKNRKGQNEAVKEALSIMEEIINEVSVGKLARAIENSAPKRKENSDKALQTYYKAADEYEEAAKKHLEEEPALYQRLQDVDKAACKEFDKNNHAQDLKDLNLPKDSKVSANKLFKAAGKELPKRDKEYEEATGQSDSKKFWRGMKRWNRANDIAFADPVKSRNEALEEAIQLLSELFDRPDLLDDIDTTLGSPVKKTFKKIITPKKEKKGTEKKA